MKFIFQKKKKKKKKYKIQYIYICLFLNLKIYVIKINIFIYYILNYSINLEYKLIIHEQPRNVKCIGPTEKGIY